MLRITSTSDFASPLVRLAPHLSFGVANWSPRRMHHTLCLCVMNCCAKCVACLFVCVRAAPPGTSDEHISIVQYLKETSGVDGAVVITTPQEVALSDVRKELNFCKKTGLTVLGVVENMSGFMCPCCGTKSDIFPASGEGPAGMAAKFEVPFLGALPIDPLLLRSCEAGEAYVTLHPDARGVKPFLAVVQAFVVGVEGEGALLGPLTA